MMNDDVAHVAEFEGYEEFNNGTNDTEPDSDTIEPPALELAVSEVMDGTWAEAMDREHENIADSEYIQASYPPEPSPALWNPPPPYIEIHMSPDPLHASPCLVQPPMHPPHISTPPVPPQSVSLSKTEQVM
jgi:hypothetical protein